MKLLGNMTTYCISIVYLFLLLYTAAQIQQSWAYGHAVNLLAAGASKPGITGSGIHSGELGALRQFMADAPTTKVLLSHISKRPHSDKRPSEQLDVAPTLSNAPELWQENLDKYQLKALDFDANATQAGKLCDGKICCEYNITARAENASNGPVNNTDLAIINGTSSMRCGTQEP